MRGAGFCAACCLLSACSTVTDCRAPRPAGEESTLRAKEPGLRVVLKNGIGLFVDRQSLALGYIDEIRVTLDDPAQCRLIVFVRGRVELEELLVRFADRRLPAELCIVPEG